MLLYMLLGYIILSIIPYPVDQGVIDTFLGKREGTSQALVRKPRDPTSDSISQASGSMPSLRMWCYSGPACWELPGYPDDALSLQGHINSTQRIPGPCPVVLQGPYSAMSQTQVRFLPVTCPHIL